MLGKGILRLIHDVMPTGNFAKNVATLMTGTSIAQSIPVVVAPLLTRIYSPEDFGVFALYFAVSSIVGITATGRYELAIMLPKKDSDSIILVSLSVFIALVISLFLLVPVLLFQVEIANLLGYPQNCYWLYYIPLSVLLTGWYQSFNYWSNRKKQFRRLAVNRIIQNSVMACAHIGAGFAGMGGTGLVFGAVIGQGVATMALGLELWKEEKSVFMKVTKLKKLALARRYINFPKYLIVAHTLNSTSFHSPNVMLSALFSSSTAGFYMLTRRVIAVPMSIVARSIGDVFRQEATHDFVSTGQCVQIFNKTLKRLILIAILPFTIFYFVAPELFAVVFGVQWRTAGEYAQILTPMFFLQFVAIPLNLMFMVAEKQAYDLVWQIFLFMATTISIVTGYYFNSSMTSLILFSISYSIMYLLSVIMSAAFSKGKNISK